MNSNELTADQAKAMLPNSRKIGIARIEARGLHGILADKTVLQNALDRAIAIYDAGRLAAQVGYGIMFVARDEQKYYIDTQQETQG